MYACSFMPDEVRCYGGGRALEEKLVMGMRWLMVTVPDGERRGARLLQAARQTRALKKAEFEETFLAMAHDGKLQSADSDATLLANPGLTSARPVTTRPSHTISFACASTTDATTQRQDHLLLKSSPLGRPALRIPGLGTRTYSTLRPASSCQAPPHGCSLPFSSLTTPHPVATCPDAMCPQYHRLQVPCDCLGVAPRPLVLTEGEAQHARRQSIEYVLVAADLIFGPPGYDARSHRPGSARSV